MKRNPEKARAAMRRWRKAHPEKHNADSRAYYARHRDEALVQSAAYHRAHPEIRKASDSRRRLWKIGTGASYTAAEWLALVGSYGGRCGYCHQPLPLHADHRVPLSRGGSNTIDNIIPACARCNTRKGQSTEAEFRARLDRERPENR
jgi:5-methylcytosine-specific restriction endonuclease McrA